MTSNRTSQQTSNPAVAPVFNKSSPATRAMHWPLASLTVNSHSHPFWLLNSMWTKDVTSSHNPMKGHLAEGTSKTSLPLLLHLPLPAHYCHIHSPTIPAVVAVVVLWHSLIIISGGLCIFRLLLPCENVAGVALCLQMCWMDPPPPHETWPVDLMTCWTNLKVWWLTAFLGYQANLNGEHL